MRPFVAQLRAELQLVFRNGEQLLVTLGIPVLLLVFFSVVDVLPTGPDDAIDFLAPGILALAVMSTAMVSLGISTGFERSYQVLKRLAVTPLGRPRLIASKISSVAVIELLQLVLLVTVALLLGWSPEDPRWIAAAAAVIAGTAAFAGLGLLMAGVLRGEVNLAAQNGLYLVLLLLGGIVIPLDELPLPLRGVSYALPSTALADVLRESLSGAGHFQPMAWVVLLVWALAAPFAAARLFRWT
jgi:ABC-2 type transport system permease protein